MPDIVEIESLADARVRAYAQLTEPQLRSRMEPALGLFIAEGQTAIEAALEAGCAPRSFLVARRHIQGKARALLENASAVVYTGDDALLEGLTGYRLTRGLLAAFVRPAGRASDEVIGSSRRIAVFEDVFDPANLGALFRSAAGLGLDGALLTGGCADPLNRRTVRTSMGCVFRIPWARCPDVMPLREAGFVLVGAALGNSTIPLQNFRPDPFGRYAVLVGNEWNGLRRESVDACDVCVKIPMRRGVDSLNVAAAASIVYWHLVKDVPQ